MIFGDSIIKYIDGWHLNKRMRSTVSNRSIPVVKIKGMLHHVKGCLEDTSPDQIFSHHDTNVLRSNDTPGEIADKILSLAASIETNENHVFISGLVVRTINCIKKALKLMNYSWVNVEPDSNPLSLTKILI